MNKYLEQLNDILLEGLVPYRREWTEVSFLVPTNSECRSSLPRLLKKLQHYGDIGHSATVMVEEPSPGEDNIRWGFDGDGSDRIKNLRVGGVKIK
jgi:hypothetical protein